MALGVARPGGRDGVRTIHKSLFAAFVLGGLDPVFVRPELDPRTGLPGGMPPQRVRTRSPRTRMRAPCY